MPTATEHGTDPKTGLIPTLKRTLTEFQEDNLTDWAAAMTYYGLLAIFPALIALVSIVGLVFDPQKVTNALTDLVAQVGPASAADTFRGPIEGIASSSSKSGIFLVVGIVLALSSASGYVGAFMRASNVMYEVDEGRPIYKLRPLQMLVTLVLVLMTALIAVSVVATGPLAESIGDAIGLGSTAVTVWDIAKWPVMVLLVGLMVSILYVTAPNAKLRGGFKFVTIGSAVAVLVWIVASALFAFYVSNFGSYDTTYGSLGGLVIFLVWLWLTNVAILLGNQLNAERERDRELQEGRPGADREIRLPERDAPKEKARPDTA
jgi:membrane protein